MPSKASKDNRLQVVIVTGLSGAGKSQAIHVFEDMGYFCIDNLPASLIPKLAELLSLPGSKINKVALGVDIRGGEFFQATWEALADLKTNRIPYRILFLEASNEVLVKRFKETRRRHPLAEGGEIIDGIEQEKAALASLRDAADLIIDTTGIPANELKGKIRSEFLREGNQTGLSISVVSFGYKYGIPMDADLVFDVRFLPNPHYEEHLRPLTGQDSKVREYVLERPVTKNFLKKTETLLGFLVPLYAKEGKTHLTIALGCTGGAHRSVAIAREIQQFLKDKGFHVVMRHRDIGRDTQP